MNQTKMVTVSYSYQANDGMTVYEEIKDVVIPQDFIIEDLNPNKTQFLKSLIIGIKGPLKQLEIHTPTEFNFLNK